MATLSRCKRDLRLLRIPYDHLLGNNLCFGSLMVKYLPVITGSASGGISIALELMSKPYIAWADQAGLGYELLHRIASMSWGDGHVAP